MANQGSLIHSPLQGFVDIKPLSIGSDQINLDLMPIVLLLLGIIISYWVLKKYKITRKRYKVIGAFDKARHSLKELHDLRLPTKELAEKLLFILKLYLRNIGISQAMSFESSLNKKTFVQIFKKQVANLPDDIIDKIYSDLKNLVDHLEYIEYSRLGDVNKDILEYLNVSQQLIDSIHSAVGNLQKKSKSKKKIAVT